MSLKAFHVIFITAAVALAFGFAWWMLAAYRSPEGVKSDLIYGVSSLVVGVGLIAYELVFLKKLKSVSYL
jgi:hypothetical protein